MSLIELLTGATEAAEKLNSAAIADKRSLTDDEQTAFDGHMAEARKFKAMLDEQTALGELRSAARAIPAETVPAVAPSGDPEDKGEVRSRVVVNEAPTYAAKGAQRNWFGDAAAFKLRGDGEAAQRLAKFAEVEGRAYAASGATTGGALVPPAYMQDQFAAFKRSAAPILNVVRNMPHPGTNSAIIPSMDAGTAVARYAENGTLTETSATTAQLTLTNYRVGGVATLPGELMDFSTPGIDQIVAQDLAKALAVNLAGWVINGSGSAQPYGVLNKSGIGAVTYTAGTATPLGLWAAIVKAISTCDTAYFRPTHIVMHPRRFAWLVGQGDGNDRPYAGLLAPQNAMSDGSSTAEGVVGSILGLPIVIDANVPITLGNPGTNQDAVFVFDASESLLFTGPVAVDLSQDYKFGNDQVTVRAKQDAMFGVRLAASVTAITGTGLDDTL